MAQASTDALPWQERSEPVSLSPGGGTPRTPSGWTAAPPRDPGAASPAAISLARDLGLSITVADILHRAGRGADETTRRFLDPRLSHLTPPEAMADREVSAERIARAVRARERIAIFGDYDCDGITATAVLTGILRALGAEVVPLLATRTEGSYGLSMRALARISAARPSLLITCDCGSSDHERLAAARMQGIDCIVIDHHLVPDEPLPAIAFLNPHRAECGFPYKGLASCGLALSVGAAVRKKLGVPLDLRPFLDLVAIGTIADVAPLDGDNRALVRAGLVVLQGGARPGLRALAGIANMDFSRGLSAEDVAFRIAPRLNAPGRLGEPDVSLELLLAQNAISASALAASIEQAQMQRRAIQEEMLTVAFAEIERNGYGRDAGIVLAQPGWHPGVVGIVAGRIASRLGKPTVVIALEGASGRGSVRGPAGARLYDALVSCRHELVGFGGHQAAAGVEVRADKVGALREAWCSAWTSLGAPPAVLEIEATVRLDDRDDPGAVVADLERLEPCGEGNRAASVMLADVRIGTAKAVKGHLKLEIALQGREISAFGLDLGDLATRLAGTRASLVGRLRRDTWRGGNAVELRIERVSPCG
ncbi:single-stranded-DNA-specific exonuclease RecJ [Chondromyces apiculatus]|uniref:Single-stranded-DNA-specific exonuclease RecJ n=1 Tax=Chondromyces apiculatus DSM 436 TaxID=1192034 RepID=A0A017TDH0_9BACT|nr:single-stranded-DNA-specific exonuclease RecJ [Chondromyces apiculatus]EYF07343.1 Single-stranded-DNA-specific exonuclease RecJ [Chondromyces apiculatus DSM 436]